MRQPSLAEIRKHERIKFELRRAGTSLADVSRELCLSQASVSNVSMGHRRSERIQAAIASHLGKSPQQVWPRRYPNKEA